ncbi:MAG: alpha-L-fucosidase [Acidimicrobiales bacterium]
MTDPFADRALPDWYDDAKLGVFLHWGLYSVPGWAPQVGDIQSVLREHGPAYLLANSPYAEWYANTMRIEGSPTWSHHRAVYGDDAPYDVFRDPFRAQSAGADLDALAGVCAASGARYVVLTTKHHDGFCLWPTAVAHPHRGSDWHVERDLVGDLTGAVRSAGMRMGLYYSGGLDWSVHPVVIRDAASALLAIPQTREYAAYCEAHYRELIDRYEPSVLWNDIAAPTPLDLRSLFGHYYERVPDGVVNDRWAQGALPDGPIVGAVGQAAVRAAGWLVERAWPVLPRRYKGLSFAVRPLHHDYTTPEYAQHDEIQAEKWESTRGVGHSFGANRNERPQDVLTAAELVRSFVDIVAKGGNLLIGIGPEPDGTVPEWQQVPLRGLGDWLAVNGHAVFGSRPWEVASSRTAEGSDVRFTRTGDAVHAIVLETPPRRRVTLWGVDASGVGEVSVGGVPADQVSWTVEGGMLAVELPDWLPVSPALAISLSPGSGVRPAPLPAHA